MNYISLYPESFLAYLGIVISAIFLAFLADKSKKYNTAFVVLLFLELTMFCGFRAPSVGTDTNSYLNISNQIKNGLFDTVWGETGYKLLLKLCSYIPVDNISLIVTSILTYGFIIARFWELRNTNSFTLSILVFSTYFYFLSFNIIRQCLAMAIVFWATRFLEKDRPILFLFIIAICIFIHSSSFTAIGFFVLYLYSFRKGRVDFKTIALIVLIAILGILVFINDIRVQRLFEKYAVFSANDRDFIPLFRIAVFLFFEFLAITKQFKFSGDNNQLSGKLFNKLSYFVGLLLSLFVSWFSPLNADRIALSFRQFEPLYYSEKKENPTIIKLKWFAVVMISILSFYLTLSKGRYGLMPYAMYSY